MDDETALAIGFDDAAFRALASEWLPSVRDIRIHRHNGTICLGFAALDDFVATTIGASSANIVCEVFNTFEGKRALPRDIASCTLKLALAPGLNDERLLWFFAELALLRKGGAILSKDELDALHARLRAGETPGMGATP